ncbi:MAG TPA: acyl-CoA dehydrogenase family protein [Actinomycetota bacterium]|nr:acyl-CoA dehydrogenase family protein [Actinomycetota bacterium]
MDMSFTEEQVAIRELAGKILETEVTAERLHQVEADSAWFDRALWSELAKADLLGIAIPQEQGGSGGGIVEACVLLEEVGKSVAPVPVWPTLVLGALPLARFGTEEQRGELLPGVLAGEVILTAALAEPEEDVAAPVLFGAERDGSSWLITGSLAMVPAVDLAARVLVPATTGAGEVGLFLVDPNVDGVKATRQETTTGEPRFELTLDAAAASVLVEPAADAEAVRWVADIATVGLCAMQLGVAERALEITASYTSEREQFSRPLATFQAVQQRLADAYIDVLAMRWTTWEAAWRLAEGLPAAEEVAVAKFWAAEGGQRVLAAAQHLHGGIGVDVEYPLYRYTRWAKLGELTLGGAGRHLARLGAEIRNG